MSTIRPDAPIAPEPAMIDGIFRALADPTRRPYSLAPDRLRLAEDWLATQRRLWEGRLDRMDAYLLSLKNKKETPE